MPGMKNVTITNRLLHCMRILPYYGNLFGPGNSVGIATDYRLDGPGSNPSGDEDFPHVQTGPGAHPAS